MPLNILAALTVKGIMQREQLKGTLHLWAGVAEEQLAGKAYLVRAGIFKDVDICLFTHVASNMGVTWGSSSSSPAWFPWSTPSTAKARTPAVLPGADEVLWMRWN